METFVLWYILQHLKPQSDHTLFLIQFIDEKKKVVDKIAEEDDCGTMAIVLSN